MDGGGGGGGAEVRLVKKKKGKKRSMAAAVAASEERDWEAEHRNKYRALGRDYHDLLKDTDAKKRRLESANRRKHGLLAEVKFLRKKYSSFAKENSQQADCMLTKKHRKIPSPVESKAAWASGHHGATTQVPSTSKNTKFDLNQDSVMNDEGADYQGQLGYSEPLKVEKDGVDEDIMTNDVKFLVGRSKGKSPASDVMRTIEWQDRVPLKV